MLTIRLSPDIETRLGALAKSTGRTKSFYVRKAILERLSEFEDVFQPEERLVEIRPGRTRIAALESRIKQQAGK